MSTAQPDFTRPVAADGRHLRSQITRQRIVDAALALPKEGNLLPSMQEISDRAGVSLRTTFQHFPERGLLTRAVLDELTRLYPICAPPAELAGPERAEQRLARFLDLRIQRIEALIPHRQVSNAIISAWPMLQKHRLKVRRRFRDEVEMWFAAELDQLAAEIRQRRLVALATLVDFEMWQSLRTYPDRTIAKSRSMLEFLLRAALRDVADEAVRK